jgi:hypothetical protein
MSLKSNRRHITLAVAFVTVLAVIGVLLTAHSASAYLWPKNVRGWVWDDHGNPVKDIPVTINVRWASDDSIRSTYTATTSSVGFYSKSVLGADWDPGDSIEVIATYGGDQRANTTTANLNPIQFVNVTFPYEIPEFGPSLLGLVAAGGSIGVVGVVLLVAWKRK